MKKYIVTFTHDELEELRDYAYTHLQEWCCSDEERKETQKMIEKINGILGGK